jgi:hypothetical protein
VADAQTESKGNDEAATWRGVSTLLAVVAALAVGYAMVATQLPQAQPAASATAVAPVALSAHAATPALPATPAPPIAAPPPPSRPVITVPREPLASPDASAPMTAAARVAAGECLGANDLFAWGCRAPVAGLSCARISRPAAGAEPEAVNFLCAVAAVAPRWLEARPGPDSVCSQVMVPRQRNAWSGAFLCVAADGPMTLRVSFARPIDGMECVESWEPWTARRGTQNYLCWAPRTAPTAVGDAGLD